MKQVLYIVCFLVFTVLFSSCASTNAAKNDGGVAGYNLKSKKEQMPGAAQEFLNTRLLETGMLFAGSAKGERSGIYKAKKDVEDDTFDDV